MHPLIKTCSWAEMLGEDSSELKTCEYASSGSEWAAIELYPREMCHRDLHSASDNVLLLPYLSHWLWQADWGHSGGSPVPWGPPPSRSTVSQPTITVNCQAMHACHLPERSGQWRRHTGQCGQIITPFTKRPCTPALAIKAALFLTFWKKVIYVEQNVKAMDAHQLLDRVDHHKTICMSDPTLSSSAPKYMCTSLDWIHVSAGR